MLVELDIFQAKCDEKFKWQYWEWIWYNGCTIKPGKADLGSISVLLKQHEK